MSLKFTSKYKAKFIFYSHRFERETQIFISFQHEKIKTKKANIKSD